MALYQCKVCGGNLEISNDITVCSCEHCGVNQTVPKTREVFSEKNFYRANNLRILYNFDKAREIYNKIAATEPGEAEAFWGAVLCKYGVEYEKNSSEGKLVPVCRRVQFDSIFTDPDYIAAINCADEARRAIYEEEARIIDDIQKDMIAAVKKKKPSDVLICFAESDENGNSTKDSAIANEIRKRLSDEGYSVFCDGISLSEKPDIERETSVFAALNSAKVMILLGSKPDYLSYVWTRNDWFRYITLMNGNSAMHLIPCVNHADAQDLPEELFRFSSRDISSDDFLNKIISETNRFLVKEEASSFTNNSGLSSNISIDNLLKRGMIALEDGNWSDAGKFFEQALNENAEEPRAYFGKLMCAFNARNENELIQSTAVNCSSFSDNLFYREAVRFAGKEFKSYLEKLNCSYSFNVGMRIFNSAKSDKEFMLAKDVFDKLPGFAPAEEKSKECLEKANELIYNFADNVFTESTNADQIKFAQRDFLKLGDYKDAAEKAEQCSQKIENIQKQPYYERGLALMNMKPCTEENLKQAISVLSNIRGWNNTDSIIQDCQVRLQELSDERERAAEVSKKRSKKIRTIVLICVGLVVAAAVFLLLLFTQILPGNKYDNARSLMNDGKYEDAIEAFREVEDFRDSKEQIEKCNEAITHNKYELACSLLEEEKYEEAISAFEKLGDYNDCKKLIEKCRNEIQYKSAVAFKKDGKIDEALSAFNSIIDYKDSRLQIDECCKKIYDFAVSYMKNGNYEEAIANFTKLGDYKDSKQKVQDCNNITQYSEAVKAMNDGDYNLAISTLKKLGNYKNSEELLAKCLKLIYPQNSISNGLTHSVGLNFDGSVVAVGDNEYGQCNVSTWRDIVAVSAVGSQTVGLKSNGTVVAVGKNNYGQCNVSGWRNIIAVSSGGSHTVGLKADGTVVAVGYNEYGQCNVSGWRDIVAVSAGGHHTVGLKADGTVVAVGFNENGQCNVSSWRDITSISARSFHTVGLKSDGTVVAVGSNDDGQCNVFRWENIVSISAGGYHTVGLTEDGEVVATGSNQYGQCHVYNWKDIVAVSAGGYHTIGLTADGKVVSEGDNENGQCNIYDWRRIKTYSEN